MIHELNTPKRKFLARHEHSNQDIWNSKNSSGQYFAERSQIIVINGLQEKHIFSMPKEKLTKKAKKQLAIDKRIANDNFANKTIAHILT
jgi:hypothetical protein